MKKVIIISLIFLSASFVNAQSLERTAIGSAGLAVQNGTAGLSFTTGEVATNSANLLTQGFQQPNILNNVGTLKLSEMSKKANIFPNPTVDILNIKSNLGKAGINTLSYQVFDAYGKVVLKGEIASNGSSINVTQLATASYVLMLSRGTDFSQTIRFSRI